MTNTPTPFLHTLTPATSDGAMSQRLASSCLSDDDVKSFNLDATTKSNNYGYILEVDLQYPEHLHDAHSDYPLAAENFLIIQDMLSPTMHHSPTNTFSAKNYHQTRMTKRNMYYITKLCTTSLHHENLWFYLRHGYHILKFRQSAWMNPYINFNAAKRREAPHFYSLCTKV